MACNGCGDKASTNKYDRHGNVVGSAEFVGQEHQVEEANIAAQARELSYSEYRKMRNEFRENSRKKGNEKVKEFSNDYKRIQIDELIAVYNHDEVHFKLTPSQALVALWEFVHHPDYQYIINEFDGLREQVDLKYSKLKEDKILIKWKP